MRNEESTCWVVDLGLIRYALALELQRRAVAARKVDAIPDVLLLCEHTHVITLGRNGNRENLRASPALLRQLEVEFYPTDRGGDITYHGPGQLIGYPILRLDRIRRDVAWYVRQLEKAMIRASADFGLLAHREQGLTGVWVNGLGGAPEKLGAIGVHLSRWVTSHGFAFNVSTELDYFQLIVPCGIAGKRPTSLERALGRPVDFGVARAAITRRFGEVFGPAVHPVGLKLFEEALVAHESRGELATASERC